MIKQQQNETEPTLSVNGQALTYMEEKYGEKFYYYSPWGNSLSDTRKFLAVCDSMPDQQILVQIDNYRTDSKVFRDNYLAIKHQQEVVDYLYAKITNYYADVQVVHSPSKRALSHDLPANADLYAYLSDENCLINAHIVLDANDISSKENIEEFAASITECNGSVNLSILFLNDIQTTYTDIEYLENIIMQYEYVQFVHVGITHNQTRIDWYEGA